MRHCFNCLMCESKLLNVFLPSTFLVCQSYCTSKNYCSTYSYHQHFLCVNPIVQVKIIVQCIPAINISCASILLYKSKELFNVFLPSTFHVRQSYCTSKNFCSMYTCHQHFMCVNPIVQVKIDETGVKNILICTCTCMQLTSFFFGNTVFASPLCQSPLFLFLLPCFINEFKNRINHNNNNNNNNNNMFCIESPEHINCSSIHHLQSRQNDSSVSNSHYFIHIA